MQSNIMRVVVVGLLCCVFLTGGCKSFNVEAFGVQIHAPADYEGIKMDKEEKWGVVLLLTIAIASLVFGISQVT